MRLINRFIVFSTLLLATYSAEIYPDVYAYSPQIGISSFGNRIAVWENIDHTGLHYITAVQMSVGGSWSSEIVLSTPGQYATNPKMVIDKSGNAIVIWLALSPETGRAILYGSVLLANQIWTSPDQISLDSQDVRSDFSLGINDTTSEILVIWSAYSGDTTERGVYSANLNLGGIWSNPEKLSNAL